jgi:hypothetical protein
MADSLPASAGPRTLFEAKNEIARLRRQLGHGPPAGGGKPVPKIDPQPVPQPVSNPSPPPIPRTILDLGAGNLNNKTLATLLELRTTAELFKMIRESNDARIMAAIRKELGARGAA